MKTQQFLQYYFSPFVFTSKQVCTAQPCANDIISFSQAQNTKAISYQAALPLLSKTVALPILT